MSTIKVLFPKDLTKSSIQDLQTFSINPKFTNQQRMKVLKEIEEREAQELKLKK